MKRRPLAFVVEEERAGSVKLGTVCTLQLDRNGPIPNNPALPLVLAGGALKSGVADPAPVGESVFARHRREGAWHGGPSVSLWRDAAERREE